MKTILLTFENETERDEYLKIMRQMAAYMITPSQKTVATSDVKTNGELILKVLDTIKFDPPVKSDSERLAALFVAGQKMQEGNLAELNKLFTQEITQHRGSVQIREYRDDKWVVIRQRPSH